MNDSIHILLQRILEGVASPDEVAQARERVAGDARLPEDLRAEALTVESEWAADAAGLMVLLSEEDAWGSALRDAVSLEAGPMPVGTERPPWEGQGLDGRIHEALVADRGTVDVTEAVMGRVSREATGWVHGPVLGEATRFEGGRVDVAEQVMDQCGDASAVPLADAVRSLAGSVDLADQVAAKLGLDEGLPIAEAVRAEAGQVDVVEAVQAAIASSAVWTSEGTPEAAAPTGRAANRGFSAWAGLASVAAAAVLAVGLWAGNAPSEVQVVASSVTPQKLQIPEMRFASASEVVVEDLSYSDTVQVMQTEGDEGALIIWLDEEAVL